MMSIAAARRAGARITVTGTAARSFLRAELDGVRFLAPDAVGDLDEMLRETDMLVFVTDARDVAQMPHPIAVAEAARDRGILVAAIVVSDKAALGRSPRLAALREAADMVMIVSDAEAARAVIAALR